MTHSASAGSIRSVRAWSEPVVIPTYAVGLPDPNPMFLEKRVYQGSSGRVYPNPVTDRVSDEKVDRTYEAVYLENEHLHLMILPEIGGRIHVGRDLSNGYDFFYHQHVIKPALVGLLGPWISGGVEFNWPQHHRPSTFMPVDWSIDEGADGTCTVWLSEHEPMGRLKGMVGIRLRPGRSYVEAEARLYNRTPLPQTFLWWANVAARVHDQYEVFFPPDVWYVADHAKRAMSYFPIARSPYYGIDYGAAPGGETDIRWYRNIPVPTSYMAMGSRHDFFGGYDHRADAGFVHVADHHIAPGKKLWTWGNHEFGYAWDRNLTDDDGPYVELMAGVYTDNQPDFAFLQPYETKTFTQRWYPIRAIGPAVHANVDAALSIRREAGNRVRVGVAVTGAFPAARVRVDRNGEPLLERRIDVAPDAPFLDTVQVAPDAALHVTVTAADGHVLLDYLPEPPVPGELPTPASEPPLPKDVATVDELYLTGLHLEQYRHATWVPEAYWLEAVRRDPSDARSNTALGAWHFRRGEFEDAEEHLRAAIARLTFRNPNPHDGEPFYLLGLTLRELGRDDEAYDALFKATWNQAWASASYHALAEIDSWRGDWEAAFEHLDRALRLNADDSKARDLRAAILRRAGRHEQALVEAVAALGIDPLDLWAALERAWAVDALGQEPEPVVFGDLQTRLDVALDLAAAGFLNDAVRIVETAIATHPASPQVQLARYQLAWLLERAGDAAGAARERRLARSERPGPAFAVRLQELAALEAAAAADSHDAVVRYHLGNWFYDRRRYEEAIAAWQAAVGVDPSFPTAWRNLGIAYFNVLRRPKLAEDAYRRAFEAGPRDARLLYELDQLDKRVGCDANDRLARLEQHRDLVDMRDDLAVELATLYNDVGRHDQALVYLASRRFHPWEGGEGLASAQYVRANLRRGQAALHGGQAEQAAAYFAAAMCYPENLGEGKHLLTPEHELHYHLALALEAVGRDTDARSEFELAADPLTSHDPQTVPVPLPSEATYWRALALRRLGREAAARTLLIQLRDAARRQLASKARIDYFATSLPTFLLFDADIEQHNRVECRYLEGLAELGLGGTEAAHEALAEVLSLSPHHPGALAAVAEAADGTR